MIVTSYGYTALRKRLEIVRNSSEPNDIMLIVGRVMIHERTEKKKKKTKVSKEWNEEAGGGDAEKTRRNDKTRQEIPGIKHEPQKMSVYGSYAAIIIK